MKKNNTTIVFIAFAVYFLLVGYACNDTSKPTLPTDDNKVITTLKLELKDTLSGSLFSFFYRDPDGVGGSLPIQLDTIKLDTQRVYKSTLKILNETNPNSVTDVSSEIKTEASNYIICYTISNTNLVISRTDTDGTYPLGLESIWNTKKSSSGILNVKLKHQLNLKNGSCEPGETEISVDFPFIIK
ncbi:MAG: hypothetical protein HUU47_06295 [Bacteroidetes bacterium]|nr:hypothetical protein [Bacteroidota bacterium]